MIDPRVGPEQLLRVGRMFELNGDRVSAVVAYREAVLAGDPQSAAEARRRLEALAATASNSAR